MPQGTIKLNFCNIFFCRVLVYIYFWGWGGIKHIAQGILNWNVHPNRSKYISNTPPGMSAGFLGEYQPPLSLCETGGSPMVGETMRTDIRTRPSRTSQEMSKTRRIPRATRPCSYLQQPQVEELIFDSTLSLYWSFLLPFTNIFFSGRRSRAGGAIKHSPSQA